jgi:hypothetical protein
VTDPTHCLDGVWPSINLVSVNSLDLRVLAHLQVGRVSSSSTSGSHTGVFGLLEAYPPIERLNQH